MAKIMINNKIRYRYLNINILKQPTEHMTIHTKIIHILHNSCLVMLKISEFIVDKKKKILQVMERIYSF